MRRKAFTLVEIMIVVLIIGILLAVAVPSWVQTRSRSKAQQCIATLKRINDAKEFYAQENNIPNGAACTLADIMPYFRAPSVPVCTEGGTQTVQPIGTDPTCTVGGSHPHVLP